MESDNGMDTEFDKQGGDKWGQGRPGEVEECMKISLSYLVGDMCIGGGVEVKCKPFYSDLQGQDENGKQGDVNDFAMFQG